MYDGNTVDTEVGQATQRGVGDPGGEALAFPKQSSDSALRLPTLVVAGVRERPCRRSQLCLTRLPMALRGLRSRLSAILWRLLVIFSLFSNYGALFGITRARYS